MKREKEVPAELLAYLKHCKEDIPSKKIFNTLDKFCTMPVRAAKMKMLDGNGGEKFRTAIIPPLDVYVTGKAEFKKGFLKRNALSYFIADTHKVFPYGHIYRDSGYVCLGNIFVPSAVPKRSLTMPIETLFLHNDRNLNHGNSYLVINTGQAAALSVVVKQSGIKLSGLAQEVLKKPGTNIIKSDQIWVLSADAADQLLLPDALSVMADIYGIIFKMEDEVK